MLRVRLTAPLAAGVGLVAMVLAGCSGAADTAAMSSAPTASAAAASAGLVGTDSALAGVISAEDAAIYALAVAGAHLPHSEHARIERIIERHRLLRAHWAGALAARGSAAAPPEPAYALPIRVRTAQDARLVQDQVNAALTDAYRALAQADDAAIAAEAAATKSELR